MTVKGEKMLAVIDAEKKYNLTVAISFDKEIKTFFVSHDI